MSKHVVVVGGGVIGLSCAYYLLRDGHRVTLVDRGGPVTENCSFGNAGLVVPSHIVPMAAPGVMLAGIKWMKDPESPFYVKPRLSPELAAWGWRFFRAGTRAHVERSAPLLRDLNMASRAAYEEMNETLANFDFQKRGLLMLFKTEAGLEEEGHVVEMAKKLGMPAEILDAKAAREKDPAIRMDILGAAFYPKDCHMSPGKFMVALRQDLEKRSANLRWNTEICDWKMDDSTVKSAVISSKDGAKEELQADEWVLCGGSWSPQMAKRLRLSLPMQAGKGYSMTLPKPKHQPTIPSLLMEARVAVTPMGESLRFAGTMEINGLNTDVNPRRVQGILKAIPNYFPDFSPADFEGLQAWAGLRPCSPDGLPYVGRTAKYKNLSVATGHAMMGLSLGPITGKLIAQGLSGQKSEMASKLLDPDRYA